jgi:uncharacterized membrane protein YraQ (UPF0718 family)
VTPPLAIDVSSEIEHALSFAFGMFWEILWPLILGFAISGAVSSEKERCGGCCRTTRRGRSRSACGLGAASSSCSFAAVALARSVFRRGADFTAAMAFEFASTNLAALAAWGYRRDEGRRYR